MPTCTGTWRHDCAHMYIHSGHDCNYVCISMWTWSCLRIHVLAGIITLMCANKYRHVRTHVCIHVRDWSRSYLHTHWAWLPLCLCIRVGIFALSCIHTCGHISAHNWSTRLGAVRWCVHARVYVISLIPRYMCGNYWANVCIPLWAWLCLHVHTRACGHDCAYVYIHVGTINFARTLLWLLCSQPKLWYKHNSQNVCSPAEGMPAPVPAFLKKGKETFVNQFWYLVLLSQTNTHLHTWNSFSVGVNVLKCMSTCGRDCAYVYVHTCVGVFALTYKYKYGHNCAYVIIYVWVWSRSCVHARWGWLCLYIYMACVRVITLMSAHTSEHDHAHVWVTCGRDLYGVYMHMLAWSCLCVDIIFDHDRAHVYICI